MSARVPGSVARDLEDANVADAGGFADYTKAVHLDGYVKGAV
jgi:hypothetical protein